MPDEELKARVFISCGQRRGTNEENIAKDIKTLLEEELGYNAYVATEHQSVKGVPEIILAELESSDYFLFIDFKRETLVSNDAGPWKRIMQFIKRPTRRGSLFCHQELAVASYLDIPIIAFHEEGVERDGLAAFESVNSKAVKDGADWLKTVAAEIETRDDWRPDSKNQLRLCRDPEERGRAVVNGEKIEFFHISVRNLHKRKPAFNCYVYLEKVIDVSTNRPISVPTIEFKWAGVIMRANALILPCSPRDFDALLINHKEPRRPRFNVFADSSQFEPQIQNCTEAELTYVVVSENFPLARITCRLRIDDDPQKTSLVPVDTTPLDSKTCETPGALPPSEPYGDSSTSAMPM